MQPSAVTKIEAMLPDDAVVLDIGAWGRPFRRANWVMDAMPYETRGLYGFDGAGEERFDMDHWIRRDICDREPFPFADNEIDFVICSHTLEDIRDPVWVCSEIRRIAKAGYLETPSRYEEQAAQIQGPWTGWSHHHWLVDVDGNKISFLYKHNRVHFYESDKFPRDFWVNLAPDEKVVSLWWEGTFDVEEKLYTDFDDLHADLEDFVTKGLASHAWRPAPKPPASRVRSSLGHLKRAVTSLRSS